MNSQDHKTAATSLGREGSGVHLCHRCGWPFPKPHPSSKHRRAHKKHCGTIEGYKIILSEEHEHNLAVSDDEKHASDDEHTPSPNLVKKNAEGSGKVGDKSNKSEDDVFSDAVTEFSDSGISPRLEERFESVREMNNSMDQKGLEGSDLHGGGSLKVDEIADINEQSNDPRKSVEVPSAEPLVSGTNAEAVLGQDAMKSGQDSNIQAQEDKLASAALNSEESKISEEDLCDNSASGVVKRDLPSQTETFKNVHSAENSTSYETGEVALVDETQENIDASVGVEEASQSTKDVVLDRSISNQNMEFKDALDTVETLDSAGQTFAPEVDQTTREFNNGEEKSNGKLLETGNENSEDAFTEVKAVLDSKMPSDDSTGFPTSFAVDSEARNFEELSKDDEESRDDGFEKSKGLDTVTGDVLDKNVLPTASFEYNNDEEKSNGKLLETGNEKSKVAFTEVKTGLDSKMPSDDSTGFPTSFAVDSEARNFEELSKDEEESRDDGFENSKGLDTVTVDVVDKNALPTASFEFSNDEEKSNGKLLETGNEKSEGAFTEVKAVLDSKTSSDDSTGYPTSFAVDSEARNFEELSKDDEESRDDGFEKSKGLDTVSGDVLDKNALPTASFEFNNNEETSNGNLLETGNEKSEGTFTEVKAGLDSKTPSDDSTGFPASFAVDSEARNFEELSKDEEESRNDGFEKSKGLDTVTGGVLDKNSLPAASLEVPVSPIISEPSPNIHVTGNGDTVESVDVVETICVSKEIVSSEKTPEQSIAKESASLTTESELLSESSADNVKESESIDSATETSKLDLEDDVVLSREISENPTPKVLEASATSIVSSGEVDGNVLESGKCSVTPSLKDPVSSPSDLLETCATGDDKTVANVEDVTVVESKSLQVEVDERLRKENDGVSAVNHSGSSSSRTDSLEANCGSVVSDTLETNSQKQRTEEARSGKSGTFEPPSFTTLVQSGGEGEEVKAAKEIETEQNNLQAGWFPSIKNVVNESEGRKKNEEIIAKVTNWSPVKQQHGPLKSLLDDVKSPRSSSPGFYQKIESENKDNNGGVVTTLGSVMAPTSKDQETNKDVEEWNSPARYPPIGIKEEKKKKTRSFWVPFVCCSSVHRDL